VSADAVTPEAFQTVYKDFSLAYDAAQRTYEITKRVNGRVMISNYDPSELSQQERRRLHEEAEEVPYNDVLIDIRAGHVGGDMPIKGRLRLRSFHEVLTFVGRGIAEERELDVTPDPRTPHVTENPVITLEVVALRSPPEGAPLSVELNGLHYAIRPQQGYPWNLKAFSLLSQLFQMSVATVAESGPPIAIAR
jgi:hypothetical protein